MENLAMLKKMVCLLSCQPRNMSFQLPAALDCLKSAVDAQAVGIYWRDAGGPMRLRAHRPARFRLEEATRRAIESVSDPAHPTWGDTKVSWLAVPMKVGGTPSGRLWVVAARGRSMCLPLPHHPQAGCNNLFMLWTKSHTVQHLCW